MESRRPSLVVAGLVIAAVAACAPRPAVPDPTATAEVVVTPVSATVLPASTPTSLQSTAGLPSPILTEGSAPPTEPPPTPNSVVPPLPGPPDAGLTRGDAQGQVEFVITPLNLKAPAGTFDFDVSMNTHSVDLGWDLAAQSMLATDTGREVGGQSWPVGGGHHYNATLSFPATTAAGLALLDGAASLTLTIRDTDVPERVFTWDLAPLRP